MKPPPQILNGMAIRWVKHTELPKGLHQSFAKLFAFHQTNEAIKNAQTEIKILAVAEQLYFPVSINSEVVANTFVCSPFTAYILYAKDELQLKVPNKLLQLPILFIIKILELFLKLGKIDTNVHVNNFLLSTNPYQEWEGMEIPAITAFIKSQYPNHALVFRSLNIYQHKDLITQFENQGYKKIGSRQVYIYDEPYADWWKHNNNKNDARIIKKQKLHYLSHEEMKSYLSQALALYNLLYIEKYSKYNPQFTLTYFQHCYDNKMMHFQGYADEKGRLKAFSGLFVLDNTITSPLVGYDIYAPQKEGLYIHAIQLIMKYKFESGKLLNLSSGASQFKRMRGGQPSMEYTVVYTQHLPFYRKAVWRFLQYISNHIGIPLIEKYEL